MKSTILLLSIFFTQTSIGQNLEHSPYNRSTPDSIMMFMHYENKEKTELVGKEKKYRKDYEEIYNKVYSRLKLKITENHYLFDSELSEYFDYIFNEICSSNPEFDCSGVKLYLASYPYENATCYSEGTIVFNLGLYRKLETESQIAFILCHELAHYFLKHGQNSIDEYIEIKNSEAYKEELKKIEKSEYNKRSRALKLLKDLTYDDRYHSRSNELSADSLGLYFLTNTKYSLIDGISTLLILDTINNDKYHERIAYKDMFHFEAYPFKSLLLEEEESIFGESKGDVENFDMDSLKTHPDCQKRFRILAKDVDSEIGRVSFLQEENFLIKIKNRSDFEFINSFYEMEAYGKALFYSLKLNNVYPKNRYSKEMIGKCFYELSLAKEKFEFSRYVEQSTVLNNSQYEEFLVFLNNLRRKDINYIGFYFMETFWQEFQDCETYLFQLILNASRLDTSEKLELYSRIYIEQYSNEKNVSFVKELNTLKQESK